MVDFMKLGLARFYESQHVLPIVMLELLNFYHYDRSDLDLENFIWFIHSRMSKKHQRTQTKNVKLPFSYLRCMYYSPFPIYITDQVNILLMAWYNEVYHGKPFLPEHIFGLFYCMDGEFAQLNKRYGYDDKRVIEIIRKLRNAGFIYQNITEKCLRFVEKRIYRQNNIKLKCMKSWIALHMENDEMRQKTKQMCSKRLQRQTEKMHECFRALLYMSINVRNDRDEFISKTKMRKCFCKFRQGVKLLKDARITEEHKSRERWLCYQNTEKKKNFFYMMRNYTEVDIDELFGEFVEHKSDRFPMGKHKGQPIDFVLKHFPEYVHQIDRCLTKGIWNIETNNDALWMYNFYKMVMTYLQKHDKCVHDVREIMETGQ